VSIVRLTNTESQVLLVRLRLQLMRRVVSRLISTW
jgi:hypothetical protein